MTPSNPIVANAIAAMMAMVAMLALAATPVAAAAQDAALAKRGIGWLYDYCDDDWAIMPLTTLPANATSPIPRRSATGSPSTSPGATPAIDDVLSALPDLMLTAGDDSGGMDKRCDRCSRCTFLEDDVCMMCSCSVKDGSYKHWAIKDLDDDLRVDWDNDRICCGEWWGGPYCGFRGKPPKPAVAGQINYLPTLWP
ncbi:hypothetical protein PG985_008001 [Apiospora marii]|uniref:uncharacterized protein n=1 Tax=Apiospora marii TaxID=335849 RepID=UPI00312E5EDE